MIFLGQPKISGLSKIFRELTDLFLSPARFLGVWPDFCGLSEKFLCFRGDFSESGKIFLVRPMDGLGQPKISGRSKIFRNLTDLFLSPARFLGVWSDFCGLSDNFYISGKIFRSLIRFFWDRQI